MQKEIGQKINELRTAKGLTLKDLSEKTNLSVSFISQAERGQTSVAIMSLKKIAEALNADLALFFDPPKSKRPLITRSYEQEVFRIEESKFIHSSLSSDIHDKKFEPMVVTILPNLHEEEVIPYSHDSEEFIYVLEGVLTLFLEDNTYELYPGDSAHYSSSTPHNWANFTNRLVKIISVTSPSFFNGK
ncbi:HTH-type transcriptional regulator PuuR [Oxobacter pfennigii]|uniref:HTH-type transcriptional regulator PuuR n=1 Tax=Oxobacter pfennigii TaxID=36849 RepID=A0A0P8YTU2_9CLOT|nr:cupin domain-containing protein [Oxobacter pfennigii]KPU43109.1 HTH-type transcriptional regulator PuuR [Oxobacter pfennigii]